MGRKWQLDDHNAEHHPEHDAEFDAAFGTESVELELPEHGLGLRLRHGVLELERCVVQPVEPLTGRHVGGVSRRRPRRPFAASPRYEEGQFAGAEASIRRAAAVGTNCTAIVSATAVPSLWRTCESCPPGSVKLWPAV